MLEKIVWFMSGWIIGNTIILYHYIGKIIAILEEYKIELAKMKIAELPIKEKEDKAP